MHIVNISNMGMVCCTQDDVKDDKKDTDYSIAASLVNLPTELLIKILLYLPTRDKVMMRYVSQRFHSVSEMPLLWRELVWSYEPCHVCSVSNALKTVGEHVRHLFFPSHVIPTKILEMARCCTKVTHLSLPSGSKLSQKELEEIVHKMRHLQQLDVYVDGNFIHSDKISSQKPQPSLQNDEIKWLLKVTATSVTELTLQTNNDARAVVASIKEFTNHGINRLPSVINISGIGLEAASELLFEFWSTSTSKLPSFEIGLYDNIYIRNVIGFCDTIDLIDKRDPKVKCKRVHLYSPKRLIKFGFGPIATSPLIQLSSHGIVDLKDDVFYLSEYDHYGAVRHAITPAHHLCKSLNVEEKHFNYTSHLHSVTHVNISCTNVCSEHLKQLAVVCPNLQQLNLRENLNCLRDLQGLHAIVHTCQNLEGLNLTGISVSSVESHLLLWELLSSLKKLNYLDIDLCMLKPSDANDASKQKLVNIFERCCSLQALKINGHHYLIHCRECHSNALFLFSHFPSLTYCNMNGFPHSGIDYAIANCHNLKHLYESGACVSSLNPTKLLPLSNNCHLQTLSINALYTVLTDEWAKAISAHGGLESVVLSIHSITMECITTLIKYSPNLVVLDIGTLVLPLKDKIKSSGPDITEDVVERLRKTLPHHKLLDIGRFTVYIEL